MTAAGTQYELDWRVTNRYRRVVSREMLSQMAQDLRVEDEPDAVLDALYNGSPRTTDLLAELADEIAYVETDDAMPLSMKALHPDRAAS